MAADVGGPAPAAAGGGPGPSALEHPLPFRLLPTAPSSWDPASASVTLNVRLDGCIVPSEASEQGARIAYSHAVVIDNFIDDATRLQLLHFLAGPPPATDSGPAPLGGQDHEQDASHSQQQGEAQQEEGSALPADRWERRTTDMAGGVPTWGVKQSVLQELAAGQLSALQEVHARLCKLYPEAELAHLPTDAIQLQEPQPVGEGEQQHAQPLHNEQQEQQLGETEEPAAKRSRQDAEGNSQAAGAAAAVDCACFVANAAVAGDSFRYHVDADPTSFPDGSPWHAAYGDYFNGEPGRPLLVSLLLYLNDEWRREWGADTLFLDGQTDTGFFVAPRPCRAVLFDQDIMHRVSPPSAAAGDRPRFSLVWKLALLPRQPGQALCLARPEWGPPASIGSAARVDTVKRQLAAEHRQQHSK